MNIFNEPKINLNMNGNEYIEFLKYKKSLKKKLTKNQVLGIAILLTSLAGIILTIIMIKFFFFPTPAYVSSVPSYVAMGWPELIKNGAVIAFPFILVAWVIHGVQVRLLA